MISSSSSRNLKGERGKFPSLGKKEECPNQQRDPVVRYAPSLLLLVPACTPSFSFFSHTFLGNNHNPFISAHEWRKEEEEGNSLLRVPLFSCRRRGKISSFPLLC